jgi:hypothetical protein
MTTTKQQQVQSVTCRKITMPLYATQRRAPSNEERRVY